MMMAYDITANQTSSGINLFYDEMSVHAGGVAENTVVKHGGNLYVYTGGAANNTTMSNGYMEVYSGGSANNTAVSAGYLHIYSSGTAASTTVYGGRMEIHDGGEAVETTVDAGGTLVISKGGTAETLTVNENGKINVAGSVSDLTVSAGGIFNGFTFANDIAGVEITGGVAEIATQVSVAGKDMSVDDGGTAEGVVVNSGNEMSIWRGGRAEDSVVNDHGRIAVYGDAVADGTTINDGGEMLVWENGEAVNTVISGGNMLIDDGGTAAATVINGGEMDVLAGGMATDTTINAGGTMIVYAGGAADGVTVESNGYICIQDGGAVAELTLKSGGIVGGFSFAADKVFTQITDGNIAISENVSLLENEMTIADGGVGSNTTVHGGGVLFIAAGGVHRGTLHIESEAWVEAEEGAVIDFTIAGTAPSNEYLINDLSMIAGAPVYTITISENQTEGLYRLAQNAADFTGSITIVSGETVYGTVTVNDEAVTYNGVRYALKNESGNLTLRIGDFVVPPSVSVDISAPTNGNVTVTAEFGEDSVVREFSYDNITWQEYSDGVLVGSNCTLYFRGVNEAGKTSEVTVFEVTNIDKTPPTLEISGIPEFWVDTAVTLNAVVSDGNVEFFNGSEWIAGAEQLVSVNGTYKFRVTDAVGNVNETTFVIDKINLSGNPAPAETGAAWLGVAGVETYQVAVTPGGTSETLYLDVTGNGMDFYASVETVFSWQVSADGGKWHKGNDVVVQPSESQLLFSDGDGDMDIFFARTDSKWYCGYNASHCEFGENVSLTGKNRITDIFAGAESDANLLVLSDDANGDALFLEDIYTGSGESARISQISEIRAGAGDDVIDLTSYKYHNSDVTVYGGSGNDTIWADGGANTLFGDVGCDRIIGASGNDTIIGGAGDDSLHGGGGEDVFCFGGSFGNDTVEQIAGGKVTLYFDSEAVRWNEVAQCYTDGTNSVKLIGDDFAVEVKYSTSDISIAGAFADFASETVFEKTEPMLLS